MDPKQKSPLGDTPGGGQEGQNPSSASAGANSGASPVFSSGTDSAPAGTPASDQKMPGTLGAENLSTGANVSRTMDSLNSKNQSETGTSVFSKHKFDRAEPDGSILIPESKGLFFRKSRGDKDNDVTGSMIAARGESVDGLDPETRRKRRILRIGGIVGGALAVILAVVIVVVLVAAPRGEKVEAPVAVGITMEQAFKEYSNYLLTGDKEKGLTDEEAKNAFIAEGVFNDTAYANRIINDPEIDDYIQYVDNLNNLYKTFLDLYKGELSDEQLRYLPAYYYNVARSKKFSEQDVRNRFTENNNEEETKKYIREFVNPDIDRYSASRYLGLKYKYLIDYVSVLVEAHDNKCVIDGYGEGQACQIGETYNTYAEDKASFEAEKEVLSISASDYATQIFAVLYDDLIDDSIIDTVTSEASA